ncbi:SGNH/GDSL hydrolase family protein [Cohnella thailandensis]|uniref:SGNH/GDSL hydrolase family protein n=1 Tax=Cohnella thailandensis TaxID=557557 RepID=A0A841SVL0_9BACL|nr:SGNH/GDSL hydrolase family protein [Cohnella thailandensis]MBB6634115.1 SGNH/GDSL hydrolase family protein [Cohnella thailandensis]MBP1972392.1 lysophospholipase L1-like esterase [Cohnella thailandensis]
MPMFGEKATIPAKKRIVFLGDSITDDGTYISYLDAYFRLRKPEVELELINLGVSSETASGLSEPAHPFPRPCVFDRLNRALAETEPEWVVVCYGMNDGIYYPLSEERFEAYKAGMRRLLRTIRAAGAKAIAVTPPPFDPGALDRAAERLRPANAAEFSYDTPYEDYEAVLKTYADWVLELDESRADGVASIHEPMLAWIREAREKDPEYRTGDGIHPNRQGHWVIAKSLLAELFGVKPESEPGYVDDPEGASAAYPLVWERHRLLSAAWKEHVGHTNIWKAEGALPLAEAKAQAAELEARIRAAAESRPEERFV